MGAVGLLWTWTVSLAAIVVALVTGGRGALRDLLSRVVRWRVGWRWYVVVLLGPAVFAALVAGLGAVLGGTWDGGRAVVLAGRPSFVHRVRDPEVLVPSTVPLERSVDS